MNDTIWIILSYKPALPHTHGYSLSPTPNHLPLCIIIVIIIYKLDYKVQIILYLVLDFITKWHVYVQTEH